jgi:hypothetical protein
MAILNPQSSFAPRFALHEIALWDIVPPSS